MGPGLSVFVSVPCRDPAQVITEEMKATVAALRKKVSERERAREGASECVCGWMCGGVGEWVSEWVSG